MMMMITPADMMRAWFQAWFAPVDQAWFAPASRAWFAPASGTWFAPASRAWFPFGGQAFVPAPFQPPANADAPVQRAEVPEKPRRVRPVTVSIAGNHAAVALLPMKRTTH